MDGWDEGWRMTYLDQDGGWMINNFAEDEGWMIITMRRIKVG